MPWPTSVSEYRGSGPLRAVVSGLGAVRERLAAHLVDQNVTRPMIVCGESVSRSPVLELVREALGDVWSPFVFDGSRPHTPAETVAAGAAAARAADADALIAVGGGSTMDCARGIAVLLATDLDDVAQLTPAEYGKLGQRGPDRAGRGPSTDAGRVCEHRVVVRRVPAVLGIPSRRRRAQAAVHGGRSRHADGVPRRRGRVVHAEPRCGARPA